MQQRGSLAMPRVHRLWRNVLLLVLLCRRGRRPFLHNLCTLGMAKDPLCCLLFFKKLCQGIASLTHGVIEAEVLIGLK